MTGPWRDWTLLCSALAVLIYATGDLLDFWEMQPLVVLILSGVALLTGLSKVKTDG